MQARPAPTARWVFVIAVHLLAVGCYLESQRLAYVAMFSTMPTALRVKALKGVTAETFNSFDRFTPMLCMFDPMRFGEGAYRPFSAKPNPASVIRTVFSGQALTD